ncbi:MAG: type II toxin-antitoxin system VapC family toxin, partial [Candidatus Bathyarchaeia archaeon]
SLRKSLARSEKNSRLGFISKTWLLKLKMKLVLDTSFLIELKKKNEKAIELLEKYKSSAEDVIISRLTHYELLVGCTYLYKKTGDLREYLWLEGVLQWVTVNDIKSEVIKLAAELKAKALLEGNTLSDLDLLIATSGGKDCLLLTFDESQERMSRYLEEVGVKVEYLR